MSWQRVGKTDALSVVMLLRAPHLFQKGELQLAAETAWHVPFSGGTDSMHCVSQLGQVTLLKAGPHLLNFFYYPNRYIEMPDENVGWLPQLSQQRAWAEHRACTGVDYMNPETDVELGYCVLAKVVAELLNENCTGLYFPRENTLAPNDLRLYPELQKIASVRDMGVTPSTTRNK